MFFSWLEWGCGFWGWRSEVRCYFHHILPRVHTINVVYYCWYWPWSSSWGSVCHQEVILFSPFPYFPSLWKKSHYFQPTLEEWGVMLPSLKAQNLCKFFCRFVFFSLIYLFSHLYQHALMDIYFIIWFIIQYFFILLLRLFSFGHWAVFHVASVSLWHTSITLCVCVCTSLTFRPYNVYQAHLVYFLSQS